MISYIEHYEHTKVALKAKEQHDKTTDGKIFYECLTITGVLKTYSEIPEHKFIPKPSYSSYKRFIYRDGIKVYLDNYIASIELSLPNGKVLKGHIDNNFFKGFVIGGKKDKYVKIKINKYNCLTYSKMKICIDSKKEL
jgi:hypothetical protein